MREYFFCFINIIGGLAVFLYGVQQSALFFRQNLGSEFRDMMGSISRRKDRSFFFGMLLSAVTQSSTIATSFAIGFVDVGLLPFMGSVMVMMGASLGGTFVSLLLSLNLFDYAPVLFAAAFFAGRIKNRRLSLVMGMLQCLSLIFLGMLFLKYGTTPLFDDEPFRQMVLRWSSNPFVMAFAAFLGAGILQSSSAVMALGITLAASDALPGLSALSIALGAHIGSTTMIVLAGLGGRLSAKRLGAATFLYKFIGVLLFTFTLPFVHLWMLRLGLSVAQELVYGQILLALFNIVIFLPFADRLSMFSIRLISGEGDMGQPRYIDEELLSVPSVAVLLLSREMARLSNYMEAYLQMLLEPQQRNKKLFEKLPASIDELSEACQEYSYKIRVLGEEADLQRQFSTISHTMTILRSMSKTLCGGLHDSLSNENTHEMLKNRLGAELWENWAKLSRRMMRTSLRAFVIGEKGLVTQSQELEQEFNAMSSQIRRDLGEKYSYDRSISQTLRMISLMQSFLGMSKVLAEDEDIYRVPSEAAD